MGIVYWGENMVDGVPIECPDCGKTESHSHSPEDKTFNTGINISKKSYIKLAKQIAAIFNKESRG